jgi:hypothetical protein
VTANPARIHSIAEAYLLLMVTPCSACGKGPFEAVGREPGDLDGRPGLTLLAHCKACQREEDFLFDLSDVDIGESADPDALPHINPTDEPSRVIDLSQWLVLFEAIAQAAAQQTDAAESRRLGYEAAQCLEEALKFYPAGDSEWPEESAFFHDETLARFHEHKHKYARTRLVELRGRLPSLVRMEQRIVAGTKPPRKHWWRFWRR